MSLSENVLTEELSSERMQTDDALRLLRRVAPPADLPLRLRVMLSHERVRAERRWTGRVMFGWQSMYERVLRPVGAQLLVAAAALMIVVGGFATLGTAVPQSSVEANDTPLAGFSAPVYQYSSAGETPVTPVGEAPLMVQAKVNARGQVYDYRVLSGELDEAGRVALQQRMLGCVFQPARVFGAPVQGSVVLTFADVVVRG